MTCSRTPSFRPFKTSLSSKILALVVKSVKADPALGSDIDTAITISPKHTLGRTSFLSSSGANEEIANAGPKLDQILEKTAIDIFAISSRTKLLQNG